MTKLNLGASIHCSFMTQLHSQGFIQDFFARGGWGKHIIDCILWFNTGIFGIFARGEGKHISSIAYSGLIQEFLEFLLGERENIYHRLLTLG